MAGNYVGIGRRRQPAADRRKPLPTSPTVMRSYWRNRYPASATSVVSAVRAARSRVTPRPGAEDGPSSP